jgi:hypothetical protein
MQKKNMGPVDRTVRIIAGVALIPIGLVALGGGQGNLTGIVVTAVAALPILTSITGFCPAYVPFGISTAGATRPASKT